MPVKKLPSVDGQTKLEIIAETTFLNSIKEKIVIKLGQNVKVPGFREGKAPLSLIEKHLDQKVLTNEFLDSALNASYESALKELNLKPMSPPQVTVKKFVPFNQLEYEVNVITQGDIKLTDYKKIKLAKTEAKVSAEDIDKVIEDLRRRFAERKEVNRASAQGDEILIDFSGQEQTGQPVKGADGKDYPLLLGSGTFIKGFEENLIGTSPGEEKTFTLTFPKDYGVKALGSKKVTFTVKVSKVLEITIPKIDKDFISKTGPFKTLEELKQDIKVQLLNERNYHLEKDYESQLVRQIIAKSQIPLPAALVEEQIERLLRDQRQNLIYRGQTFEEFLAAEGLSEEQYRSKVLRPQAEERVKGGLALSVITTEENIFVTPEELETRIQLLKGQYQDPAMQAEFDKPENRREAFSRLLTEKTLAALRTYAQS